MLVVTAMIELELTQEQKQKAQKLCENIKPIKLLQSAITIWNLGGYDIDWKIYLVAASYNWGDLLVDMAGVYYEVDVVIGDDGLGGVDFEINWDWDFTKGKPI